MLPTRWYWRWTQAHVLFVLFTIGLGVAHQAHPAGIAYVGGATNGGTGTSTITVTYTATAGNTVLGFATIDGTGVSVSSVNGSGPSMLARLVDHTSPSGTVQYTSCWGLLTSGADTSWTFTFSGSTTAEVAIEEYSGVVRLGGVAFADGDTGSASWTCSLIATDNGNFAASAVGYNNTTVTVVTGTQRHNVIANLTRLVTLDNNVASAGNTITCAGTSGSSRPWSQVMVELKSSTGSTMTATPTSSATHSRTATATRTATDTRTSTDTATETETATTTSTSTATATRTATRTRTFTGQTRTFTSSGTSTPTRTNSPTATRSNTPKSSRTHTRTATRTHSRTASPTSTASKTHYPSRSRTGSRTRIPSPTATISGTSTSSPTATRTATRTATATRTRTFTP